MKTIAAGKRRPPRKCTTAAQLHGRPVGSCGAHTSTDASAPHQSSGAATWSTASARLFSRVGLPGSRVSVLLLPSLCLCAVCGGRRPPPGAASRRRHAAPPLTRAETSSRRANHPIPHATTTSAPRTPVTSPPRLARSSRSHDRAARARASYRSRHGHSSHPIPARFASLTNAPLPCRRPALAHTAALTPRGTSSHANSCTYLAANTPPRPRPRPSKPSRGGARETSRGGGAPARIAPTDMLLHLPGGDSVSTARGSWAAPCRLSRRSRSHAAARGSDRV